MISKFRKTTLAFIFTSVSFLSAITFGEAAPTTHHYSCPQSFDPDDSVSTMAIILIRFHVV